MKRRHRSIETRHLEERDELFRALPHLNRRGFLKVSVAAAAAAVTNGVDFHPTSFQPISVADAAAKEAFTFAYISDSHLYERKLNDRFVRSLLRAVDEIGRASCRERV